MSQLQCVYGNLLWLICLTPLDRCGGQKCAFPCLGNIIIVPACFQKWSAGYKNWLLGREHPPWKSYKATDISIKCQNLRAIWRKQDQQGCKTLGGLCLDKHCRWSCIQNPHPPFSPMQANVSVDVQHHSALCGSDYYTISNIWPFPVLFFLYDGKSSDEQRNKRQ